MQPIVDGLETTYGERLLFQQLNAATDGKPLFQHYRLRGHPVFVITDAQGEAVWQQVGQVPPETLEAAIEDIAAHN